MTFGDDEQRKSIQLMDQHQQSRTTIVNKQKKNNQLCLSVQIVHLLQSAIVEPRLQR